MDGCCHPDADDDVVENGNWRLVCHACGWKGPKNGATVEHRCTSGKAHTVHIHDLSQPCVYCIEAPDGD